MDKIKITGLREFQRALKAADAGLPKMLRLTLNKAAGIVVDYAEPRFPRKTGRAAGSLKVRSSQREVRIAMGGTRAPYAPGLDFGGSAPRFPPYSRGGRYVYKGLAVEHDKITDTMSAGLAELAREAGFEVS